MFRSSRIVCSIDPLQDAQLEDFERRPTWDEYNSRGGDAVAELRLDGGVDARTKESMAFAGCCVHVVENIQFSNHQDGLTCTGQALPSFFES